MQINLPQKLNLYQGMIAPNLKTVGTEGTKQREQTQLHLECVHVAADVATFASVYFAGKQIAPLFFGGYGLFGSYFLSFLAAGAFLATACMFREAGAIATRIAKLLEGGTASRLYTLSRGEKYCVDAISQDSPPIMRSAFRMIA